MNNSFILVCPICDGVDIMPKAGSLRYELWEQFGLLRCGDCDSQFAKAKVMEVNPNADKEGPRDYPCGQDVKGGS